MTWEQFDLLKSDLTPKAIKQGREMLVYRLCNNAEILNSDTLSYLYKVLQEEGQLQFFKLMSLSEPRLRKLAEKKNQLRNVA